MTLCAVDDVVSGAQSSLDSMMQSQMLQINNDNDDDDYNNNNSCISEAQFEIFYNLLTTPRTVSDPYARVARVQSCANHVQHIGRLSSATCHVTCHMVRWDPSVIKSDSVYIAFI